MSPTNSDEIRRAAEIIRRGGLVAFPTETVYGLGANALDTAAVERIYQAKGRPATSPVIVHVSSVDEARLLTASWPDAAHRLAARYWPGPLTLVVMKQSSVPDIVTAGLPTVGLRMPDHPVALALIREAGVPIAAPSANRFGGLSPTTADHVRAGLGEAVEFVLDGGPTRVGLESTVVSLAGDRPVLLRPGMISRSEIEEVIGPIEIAAGFRDDESHASPGMTPRHYSPRTKLILTENGKIPAQGRGAYLWLAHPVPSPRAIAMPIDAPAYAAILYDTLHRLDQEGWDWIAVEPPPNEPQWAAIRDRLLRASHSDSKRA